jgi:hypothetical protein
MLHANDLTSPLIVRNRRFLVQLISEVVALYGGGQCVGRNNSRKARELMAAQKKGAGKCVFAFKALNG